MATISGFIAARGGTGDSRLGQAGTIGLLSLLAVLVGMALFAPAKSGAVIHWGENFTSIGRADLNGAKPRPTFIKPPAGSNLGTLAVTDTHVYWANYAAPVTIGRAKRNGQGVNQNFITGDLDAWAIAVSDTHVYWGNYDSGTIGRARLDGKAVNENFINTGVSNQLYGLDVQGNYIYWATTGGNIGRARLNGTGVNGSFISLGPGAAVYSVAVTGSHIYWTDNGALKRIGRANLNGTGVNAGLVTGLSNPNSITVLGKHIYWTDGDLKEIRRANLNGSGVRVIARNLVEPWGLAVDWAKNSGHGFSFGKVKQNRRKGTAQLRLKLPGPGRVQLKGKNLRKVSKRTGAAGMRIAIKPKGKLKRKLKAKGRAKVKVRVTFRSNLSTGKKTKKKTIRLRRR